MKKGLMLRCGKCRVILEIKFLDDDNTEYSFVTKLCKETCRDKFIMLVEQELPAKQQGL